MSNNYCYCFGSVLIKCWSGSAVFLWRPSRSGAKSYVKVANSYRYRYCTLLVLYRCSRIRVRYFGASDSDPTRIHRIRMFLGLPDPASDPSLFSCKCRANWNGGWKIKFLYKNFLLKFFVYPKSQTKDSCIPGSSLYFWMLATSWVAGKRGGF